MIFEICDGSDKKPPKSEIMGTIISFYNGKTSAPIKLLFKELIGNNFGILNVLCLVKTPLDVIL